MLGEVVGVVVLAFVLAFVGEVVGMSVCRGCGCSGWVGEAF